MTREEQAVFDATRDNLQRQGVRLAVAEVQAKAAVNARRQANRDQGLFGCGHAKPGNTQQVAPGATGCRTCILAKQTAKRRAAGVRPRPARPPQILPPQKLTPARPERQEPTTVPHAPNPHGFLQDMTLTEVASRLKELALNTRDWGRDRHADELDHLARQALRLNINLGGPRKGAGRPRS